MSYIYVDSPTLVFSSMTQKSILLYNTFPFPKHVRERVVLKSPSALGLMEYTDDVLAEMPW